MQWPLRETFGCLWNTGVAGGFLSRAYSPQFLFLNLTQGFALGWEVAHLQCAWLVDFYATGPGLKPLLRWDGIQWPEGHCSLRFALCANGLECL
ncbi:hypothetical protein Terro_3757 [Terriglobus roseus DSM 18391]|uniref:Uncharacterized protein n=1 Tax=Terriglobus roseus (strain DSM 18391 / NRRL B-41598 / KBS 63) TaxID=926566 RepID=I3ZL50_TERRK|nr:hypothetical protein Terro_3757 [Terriglobus roseus DSM 18391]